MALQPTSDGLQPSKRYLVAKASNLLAMALQPTSDGLQPSKRYLVAKASNLLAMALQPNCEDTLISSEPFDLMERSSDVPSGAHRLVRLRRTGEERSGTLVPFVASCC